jgi:DNA mismatch repair protein MutL
MPIRLLPQSLINKIAAGEVIERPASVLKELVENSIDAGATRIDVTVQAGGSELVRVADNGCGIPADELPLALAAHATSKLAAVDDLFRVSTLGFRGEALASIAEVSRLVIRSRTADSPSGMQIEVVGGLASPAAPCGCPVGTTIEVSNLFFNTPVRRKFLRSTQTELGHLSEAFTRLALPMPEVHFTLRHNERTMFELPGGEPWQERIARLFGREVADALIWVENADGPVRLSGYVGHPSQNRASNRMQYLFLNRRAIRDRSLQHALTEAYRGLLMTGRFPVAFLSLEMPPEQVDVNVHPTKLEVRFQDSGRLYSQLLSTLRNKFLSTDLTARVPSTAYDDPTSTHDEVKTQEVRQRVVDWAKGQVSSWGGGGGGDRSSASPRADSGRPLELTRLSRSWAPADASEEDPFGSIPDESSSAAPPTSFSPGLCPGAAPSPAADLTDPRPVQALQVHNRYLITENEAGVEVIDQHALHERILYEQLRARVESGHIEAQTLLVPEAVHLTAAECAAAMEHREVLARLGMRVDAFGGDTILLASYPAMLANIDPVEVLRGLLEQLLAGTKTPDRRDLLDELLHSIACKAAIKAGDRLSPEEISSLLAQRHLVDDAHHCPHGRPTTLVFTREDLDKQFKRV